MSATKSEAAASSPPVRRREPLVPPQHGAWGFLLLPAVLGVIAGGWTWTAVPVLLGWIALFPFSWALTNRLAAPRPERFNRALRLWSMVAVPLLVTAVLSYPWLLWVGSAYAIPFAANVLFASIRRERSLANDAILIVECAVATPVVAGFAAGTGSWSVPWTELTSPNVILLTGVCATVLVGSTLHVRSLIRERGNPRFTRVSRCYAVACVPAVAVAAPALDGSLWLVLPFLAFAGRALFLHHADWRPARIGILELVGLVLVAVFSALALAWHLGPGLRAPAYRVEMTDISAFVARLRRVVAHQLRDLTQRINDLISQGREVA